MKRFIPTKAHGVFDLITGPTLVAAPELLRLNGTLGSSLPPRMTGALGTGLSALTDYETGAVRVVPVKAHLAFDAVSGAALAAAPWLTGARRKGIRHWLPHAAIGATEIAVALTTRTEASDGRTRKGWLAVGAGAGAALAAGALLARRRDAVTRLPQAIARPVDRVREAVAA